MQVTPGLVVTQHSGEGKANQYFLRGVNLDHGTDLRISLDGMLVNQRTNAHGQGYADLNFLIPELVQGIAYRKGPYYADEGDFSSVGAINVGYVDKLEKGFAMVTGGQNNYARALLADSVKLGQGNLLFASETLYNDGPWTNPEHFRKFNGVVKYSLTDGPDSLVIEGMGYHSEGNATNQIARRAFDEGIIGRYGSLNPTDGTNTSRYSLSGAWQHTSGTSVTRVNAYAIASSLDLYSDFTYFLNDPVHGDQFQQTDRRVTEAINVSHAWLTNWGGRDIQHTVGPANAERQYQRGPQQHPEQAAFVGRPVRPRHGDVRGPLLSGRRPLVFQVPQRDGGARRFLPVPREQRQPGQLRHCGREHGQPENEPHFRTLGQDGIFHERGRRVPLE